MRRKLTGTNYFIILEKKRFSREHTRNPNAYVRACPHVTFWAVGYHFPPPPPQVPTSFHIFYVKYENTLTCKRISWDSGGEDVLKYFSISYMYNTKSDLFSPKLSRTFMEIGNQMQNHKKETNSELIYKDVSI